MKNLTDPIILAIDTSCDETSVSITRGFEVLSNCLYSQLDLHAKYGGVVPSIARVEHEKKFPGVLEEALEKSGVDKNEIDYIAVTTGPGLAIALEVGVQKAKELANELGVPLLAVNHMAGHLVSGLAEENVEFPILALLISGGHTEIILMHSFSSYEKVGQTLDDACGEAFDKAARVLGLPYPGGPAISKLAAVAKEKYEVGLKRDNQTLMVIVGPKDRSGESYELPVPMVYSGDLNVSYSGLKSAFKRLVTRTVTKKDQTEGRARILSSDELGRLLTEEQKLPLSLAFETAALEAITRKVALGVEEYQVKEIWLGGGVAASPVLRSMIEEMAEKAGIKARVPKDKGLMTDNAAMIGIAAYIGLQNKEAGYVKVFEKGRVEKADRDPSWEL